jgi:hypothetical protein
VPYPQPTRSPSFFQGMIRITIIFKLSIIPPR